MNNRIYHVTIDLLNHIMSFMVVYAIMGTILLFFQISNLWALALIPLTGLLLSYTIRNKLKHIWSFLLIHLFLIATVFLLSPSLLTKILFPVYILFVTIFGLAQRLKEENLRRKNSSPSLLFVFLLLIAINTQLELVYLNTFLFQLTLLFIVLYFINSYLINFEQYFSLQQETSNVPFRQIKAANHTFIIFFLGIVLVCMVSFTRLPLGSFVSFLKNGVLSFLRWIFSFIRESDNNVLPQNDERPNYTLDDFDFKEPPAPASPLMEYIQKILTVLLAIVTIAALLALLSYAVYKLYQAFYQDKRNLLRDNTEFLSPFDKREKLKANGLHTRKKSFFLLRNQTYSDKIRKAFYKAVISNKSSSPPAISATPLELSEFILKEKKLEEDSKNNKAEAIAYYYEKARYAKDECDKKDLIEIKKLIH
ncbi:hypothetical protein [Clostridium sp. KNHs205]|uniref:hypothetical protein n=1 Tax=Clostridium sp. KNHs205 TaxID=1449050 RepID=UPI00051B97DA|nr:hypothetical protein [Clostridium sp. KNHs205]